ncbi:MAG: hypothetical protein PUA61_06790 [Succinatimonas hippei]|nr:hypothetical protein [Succinatimonas hippei]
MPKTTTTKKTPARSTKTSLKDKPAWFKPFNSAREEIANATVCLERAYAFAQEAYEKAGSKEEEPIFRYRNRIDSCIKELQRQFVH